MPLCEAHHKPQTACLANRNLQTANCKPKTADRGVCVRERENSLEETSFPVLTAAIITIYQIRDPPLQAPNGSKVLQS